MTTYFLLLQLVILANSATTFASKPPIPGPTAKNYCICTRIAYNPPLCASDGIGYSNPCEFDCAQAQNPGLRRVQCRNVKPAFAAGAAKQQDLNFLSRIRIDQDLRQLNQEQPGRQHLPPGVRPRIQLDDSSSSESDEVDSHEAFGRRVNGAVRQNYIRSQRGPEPVFLEYGESFSPAFMSRPQERPLSKLLLKGLGLHHHGPRGKPASDSSDSDSSSSEELIPSHHHRKHPTRKHEPRPHHGNHHRHHHQHNAQAPHHEHHKSHTHSSKSEHHHHSSGTQKNAPNANSQIYPQTENNTAETSSRQNQQEGNNNNNSGQNKSVAAGRTTFLSGAPPPVSNKSTEPLPPADATKTKEPSRGQIVGDNRSLLSVQKSEGQAVAIMSPKSSKPDEKHLVLIV